MSTTETPTVNLGPPTPPEYDVRTSLDFGYDPDEAEAVETARPPRPDTLPVSAQVDSKYLPPVRKQTCPACCAWSSTYGLATFTAAAAGGYSPTEPGQQASPAYIYIQVMQADGHVNGTCTGSQFGSYFKILHQGGTPTMEAAPNNGQCATLWNEYANGGLQPDAAFTLSGITWVDAKHHPDDVKAVLATGKPLVYGTSLYTDFPKYDGSPVPYVGNGVIMKTSKGKRVGHCMLIIGYDDDLGAFLLQNSFGADWGADGFVWMAYDTFAALAQGTAAYVAG